MGEYRDRELFALDDARQSGVASGISETLWSIATDLKVSPDVLDGLDKDLNLPSRIERLSLVAESVCKILKESRDKLNALQDEDPNVVAGFVLSDQAPVLDENHPYSYCGDRSVYRIQANKEGIVEIMTDLWGGYWVGSFEFRDVEPISASWVSARLAARGVDRDEAFCEQVVAAIIAKTTGEEL